jgi:hypothetical protein
MISYVRSIGFAIRWNGTFLTSASSHRGCAAGNGRIWGDKKYAIRFQNVNEAEALRGKEGLLQPYYDGVEVVELFEDVFTCCHNPHVRGGQCENCGTWAEDEGWLK